MIPDIAYWIAFSKLRDIGPVRFFQLLERYGEVRRAFAFTAEDLAGTRLSEERARDIISTRDAISPEREYELIRTSGIIPIPFCSKEYPEQLKEIYAPPYLLYALGDTALLRNSDLLAVVGTRHPSAYGQKMTHLLTKELSLHGWGIVSGMAKGIDAEAHRTTLQQGGRTIAVLGCGIDHIYPYENKHLYSEIKEKGLLISEMPPGTTPQPFLFPLRNRIVTGLCKATLVIEGDHKSGAMISGKLALEQNREVFALPGRVTDALSNGPNWLIQQGATPILSAEDVLNTFHGQRRSVRPRACTPTRALPPLPQNELAVYRLLDDMDGLTIETIADRTRYPVTELMPILSTLELKGHIEQLPGKRFVRIMNSSASE